MPLGAPLGCSVLTLPTHFTTSHPQKHGKVVTVQQKQHTVSLSGNTETAAPTREWKQWKEQKVQEAAQAGDAAPVALTP